MIQSTFDLEKKLLSEGYAFVIGIDEAGRGPLAGPVVASAVALKNYEFRIRNYESKEFSLIRDSKTLSHKQRENIFDFIHENFFVGVGICDHQTIDRINILEATYLAAKKAIVDLRRIMNNELRIMAEENKKSIIHNSKFIILFDGNKIIPNLSLEQRTIVNGDKIVKSIAAASIVAKVTRDRLMLEMHQKYPEYGFDKHKGYGTKLHMEALQQHGACPIHRHSFAPVKSCQKTKIVIN